MQNIRTYGEVPRHIGYQFTNKESLIEYVLRVRKAQRRNKSKTFLDITLDCGCHKKYHKKDIPDETVPCEHGNAFIEYLSE